MNRKIPRIEIHKWYYRCILEYPDGTQETNQSVTYSKRQAGAIRTIRTAARACNAKIIEMVISIDPIKEE